MNFFISKNSYLFFLNKSAPLFIYLIRMNGKGTPMGYSETLNRRCEALAVYLVEHETTVRETAAHFNISKSTVHKDITERLKYINGELYVKVSEILKRNKMERHLRGGMATKQKYLKLKENARKIDRSVIP